MRRLRARGRWRVAASLLAALCQPVDAAEATAPATDAASGADTLVGELEQRLARSGVDGVNTFLDAHWAAAMVPLNRRTADCDLQAVSLSMRLGRGRHARALQAHGESLRAAAGGCARFVLALAAPAEIPRYCHSLAAWGPAQTARELRRRMAAIDADAELRATRRGQACKAAYLYELNNTRVAVRRVAAP